MKKPTFYSLFLLLPLSLTAEITLTAPARDEVVPLVPENQKKIMALETHAERLAALNSDRKARKSYFNRKSLWRKALPVTFSWKCTAGECGPFRLLISEKEDFSDPVILFSKKDPTLRCPQYASNFKLGQKYYWKVIGRTADKKGKKESVAASFTTEDVTPRWIAIQGRVGNIRDLGGYRTADGKRVRQNLIFRGQGLNDNSGDGEFPGQNRLMIVDRSYLLNVLKIRTDLDLRSSGETAKMSVSPLGKEVRFVHRSSSAYQGIFGSHGKKIMAENFRLFCDRKNYPVYFHCIAGADRTGSLAMILNGVLGVPEHDLETDWEHTFYPNLPDNTDNMKAVFSRFFQHFTNGLSKYGKTGDTMQKRIELYLLDCGVKAEEIETFRKIMLE
jgi:protein-tyrosine phosphatase